MLAVIFTLILSNSGIPFNIKDSVGVARAAVDDDGWTPLFNNQNLDGWYTWLPSTGRNNDPRGVFKVQDGIIHILDLPETDEEQEFGYFGTVNEYSNYRLRFQYKWGTKRFAPRAQEKRDTGLLYHVVGQDGTNPFFPWPRSVECQVQEGDTGDAFVLGGTGFTSTVADPNPPSPWDYLYSESGPSISFTNGRVIKSSDQESLTNWNTVEVIVNKDAAVHIVNNVVVNRVTGMKQFDQDGNLVPLTGGRIVFQAEGAEVFYRNIEIKQLPSSTGPYKVLAFSKTNEFRHDSIPAGVSAIANLGADNNFTVDATEDAANFNDVNLSNYKAVVFLSTTGDVLNRNQEAAFEHFIRAGNGFVGIHAATDTEYDWPWYGELVGAYFSNHPEIQQATIEIENPNHPSTAQLPLTWARTDEWYNFRINPRGKVNVLATLNEGSYSGGTMGDHPIAWYRDYDGGRSWYTAGGHTSESFSEPLFLQHLLGGIRYAAGFSGNDGTALDRSNWIATASSSFDDQTPDKAIDGNGSTRWSGGVLQAPGQFFQLDMGQVENLSRIVMDSGDAIYEVDWARGYVVLLSDDGSNWRQVASGEGTRVTTIELGAQSARHVRIEQTGSDPVRWWSIREMNIYR